MLYEPIMYTRLLGVSSKDEVRIETRLIVETFDSQEIMVFDPVETGSAPALSIAIPIAVRGNAEGSKVFQQKRITHTIKTGVNASTLAYVRTAVGSNIYTITATTYLSGSPESNNTGTIDQNSDIEIL